MFYYTLADKRVFIDIFNFRSFIRQERGRITTSVQNDLYISPVTAADLGWWVCAATSAAGSVVSRVLLHTGSPGHQVKVTAADNLHSELVHLEEVKVTGQHSVRLTWKVRTLC